jgi:hypothetical protein
MNPDQQPRSVVAAFTCESENRLTAISGDRGAYPSKSPDLPRERFHYEPRSPLFRFEHDAQKGVFRLEWADGEVEVFRDKPARHLVVEPDAGTGEMRPVLKRGRPTYLYLCREEREVR